MTELFLDGKLAIPNQASIKLTVGNVYFTKSASYTYDVELPLDIAENKEIFGDINRIDTSKADARFSARLVVDNVEVLLGEAHVTQVSETSVKLQLLGEAAAYNYSNKMDKVYIDELDLGDWFTTTWPDLSYYKLVDGVWSGPFYYPEGTKFSGVNWKVLYRTYDNMNPQTQEGRIVSLQNLMGETYPWVAYPMLNSTTDEGYNCYKITTGKMLMSCYTIYEDGTQKWANIPFAIQPYIWIMAKKIAAATGYTLADEDNGLFVNFLYKRIFIANSNDFIECNKCLPHWTVNEWWTQIENTFGLVMDIDYATKTMTLHDRYSHYTADTQVVDVPDVVSEFTTEIDSESATDISVNNVGFDDYESAPEDVLSDFIEASATVYSYDSWKDFATFALSKTEDELKELKHVLFKIANERHYVLSEYSKNDEFGWLEVNMFRPRMQNPDNDEVEVKLKIVPCKYTKVAVDVDASNNLSTSTLTIKALSAPGYDYTATTVPDGELDLDELIRGEADESDYTTSEAPDMLYIGIARQGSYVTYYGMSNNGSQIYFNYRQAYLRERTAFRQSDIVMNGDSVTVLMAKEESPYSLSLIPIDGQYNLASQSLSSSVTIGTTVRHCFKFVSNEIPDPGAIYLIHNKKFVCEKLEANIKADGLDRLITGYFYEYSD